LATVIAAVLSWGAPIVVDDDRLKDKLQADIRGDEDLEYHVGAYLADDEGRSVAFADHIRPDPSLLRLMNQPNGGVSSRLHDHLLALGGVQVGSLTLRINLKGQRNEEIRIVDIRPKFVSRTAALGSTLFSAPSQAGDPLERMEINLYEPDPVPRKVEKDMPFGADANTEPFFEHDTISLRKGQQRTLMIRMNEDKNHSVFYLRVDYLIDNKSKHLTTKGQDGKPFQVTGVRCGSTPGYLSYGRAFALDGQYRSRPVARPDQLQDSTCS
jgi:hypothetical protein